MESKNNKGSRNKKPKNGVTEELANLEEENRENERPLRRPFSILGNLIFLCTLAIIGGIAWVVCLTWTPQDLSTLPGYKQAEPEINIPELLRQSYKKNTSLTLSEEDINRYIASTLKASQQGFLAPLAKPNGVGVRFHDGYMEVIIERQLASHYLQTVSLFITVIQEEDPTSPIPVTRLEYRENKPDASYIGKGGTLGKVTVPQGYMLLLQPAFENLATAYEDLLSSIIDNGRIIRISKGHIDLMPRQQTY